MAERRFSPDHLDLLRFFHNRGVRYLLVGGHAVIYHGLPRTTGDLDLWIAVEPDNAERVAAALIDHGFPPGSVTPETFTNRGIVFRFGMPPLRVEILTQPSGVNFEDCWRGRIDDTVDGVPLHILNLADLRQNKLAAGRPKDLADLADLPEPPP